MATKIGSAFIDVTFHSAPASAAITSFVGKANKSFGILGATAGLAVAGAAAVITKAMVDIGAASIAASVEFEQAFAEVRKTLDRGQFSAQEAEISFRNMKEELREMALATPLDLEDDITNVAALGSAMGVAEGDIVDFTGVISEMGVTTNLTVEAASEGMARFAAILKLPQEELRDVADVLINLGNNSAATEEEILHFGTRIASVGDIAGLTADEILAMATSFAEVGVPAERGATAIQKTLIQIEKAVATGNEHLTTFANTAGLTAEEFGRLWEEDASEAFTQFIEGLGQAGPAAFNILKSLQLSEARATQALLTISRAGGALRENFELAKDSANALSRESGIFYDTTQARLKLLQNAVHDAGITIGDQLSPAFNKGIDLAIEWFQENQPLIKSIGADLAGALESIVPLVENLLDGLGGIVEKAAEIADSEAFKDTASAMGDFAGGGLSRNTVGANIIDFLTQVPYLGQAVIDTFDAILDPFTAGGGSSIIGTAALAQLTIVEDRLRAVREAGDVDPVEALTTAFFDLEEALAFTGEEMSAFGFSELLDEFDELGEADMARLIESIGIDNLNADMLELLGITKRVNELQRKGARGGIERPPVDPTVVMQQAEEEMMRLAEEEEALAKGIDKIREAATESGIPIASYLDNLGRLQPELVGIIDQAGRFEVETRIMDASLAALATSIDLTSAAAGRFGVGDIINGIEQVQATIKGVGDEGDEQVDLTASRFAENAKKNLDQIATFEANLALLFARGQETLARQLAEQGPEFATVASEFVSDAGLAAATEANLVGGGEIAPELQLGLDEALAEFGVPPGLMDFVATFGSDTVLSSVFAAGQAYGDAYLAGIMSRLRGTNVAVLAGIRGAGPTPGTPVPAPVTHPGGGGVQEGLTINQTFTVEAAPTPGTQQAAQQAAAIVGMTG